MHALFGFGLLKRMLGGIVLFSSASVILMMLDRPDAPSLWPRFGLTSFCQQTFTIGLGPSYRANVDAVVAKDASHGGRLNGISDLPR